MYVAITVLIILISVVLVLAVLIQNPKGGGLSASFGGMGNQVMGARKATDFIERATWVLAVSLLVLSLLSGAAIPNRGQVDRKTDLENQLMEPGAVPAEQQPNTAPTGPTMPN